MSDDGRSAVVLIAMLGNVFSPRWAAARARGETVRSLDFSAMNVALHTPGPSAWVMTERPSEAVVRSPDGLSIGPSDVRWEGDELVADIRERSAPWGSRVRGRIRFRPDVRTATQIDLDGKGRHLWFPHAPVGRIEVTFDEPRVRFEGHGYFDANAGSEPLEEAFASWSWSRFATDESIALAYDVVLRDGSARSRGVRVDRRGETSPFDTGAPQSLGRSLFGLRRPVRAERGSPVRLVRTLEDGPFYARSLVATTLDGKPATGMHEAVSLDRFRAPWVRFLVPYRMRVERAGVSSPPQTAGSRVSSPPQTAGAP